jgi:hypothetical protein
MPRGLVCLLLCLAACACSTHKLRCEGSLQPINAAVGHPGSPSGAKAQYEGVTP